jgi:6-phosphogluconolactonase
MSLSLPHCRPLLSVLPIAATAFIVLLLAGGCGSPDADSGRRIYVGTGTGEAEDGIYTLRFDPETGRLSDRRRAARILNPTFLTLSDDGRRLYSVSETVDSASIHAYAVAASTGDLRELSAVSAEGGAPCYISLDATGRWVLTANYVGGSVAVFPVREDGGIGPATQVVRHRGSGPDPERQASPHAHSFQTGPLNTYALAADLGADEIRAYPFSAATGRLDTAAVRVTQARPGSGPRHLAFDGDGTRAYLVGELDGTLTVYRYAGSDGGLTPLQTVSTVPEDFAGNPASADVHVHPSGDFLYVSNRGDANGIAHFRIRDDGRLKVAGRQREHVRWPRTFTIAPGGDFLLVANRRADAVTVFTIDPETGALSYIGHQAAVPAPTKIVFAPDA